MYKIFLTLALLVCFFGCSKKTTRQSDVIVSTPPYLYFVNELTDKELSVSCLVPEGANPHIYEPTPRQVQEAEKAKIWVRLSDAFEQKIATSLQEKNKDLIVVNLMEEMELPHLHALGEPCSCGHTHGDETRDVHIWLSLRLAKTELELIAKALIKAFPERKNQIEKNLTRMEDLFTETDKSFTKTLSPFQGEAILVSHPAFAYFCNDYDLKQISIEYEGKDPLPKELSAIFKLTEAEKVRTVFTQAQYNNKGAEIIAEKLNLPIHEVDPYSADYLNNLNHIVNLIANP